ncbi:MAG: uracil-DNA glycosylase [Opitutales bacterium]|nr:uracil-DNA glycosylase [Opitutales bacterium]
MREELQAVVEELKAMRDAGVSHVYLADGTLGDLRAAFAAEASAGRTPVAASGPSPAEVARGGEKAVSFGGAHEMVLPMGEGRTREPRKAAPKPARPGPSAPIPPPPSVELPDGAAAERLAWLRKRVLDCPVCNAHVKPGKKVVFGVGSAEADIFFCGEAPGADEEEQGEPFVGPAGQLLTKIIGAMDLSRGDVYIGNIMNWRPEMPTSVGNRPPTAEEMAFCLPYLRAQVEVVAPKVIVALGKTAVDGLLGPDPKRKMGQVRGQWHEFSGIPLLPTFHPSYLLRNDTLRTKRMVWEDMMQVMERVGMPVSERQRRYFLTR